MLVFEEGGKPENPEKNPQSKDENQQQTQSTYDVVVRILTRATLVEGKRSHHWTAIPAGFGARECLNKPTTFFQVDIIGVEPWPSVAMKQHNKTYNKQLQVRKTKITDRVYH